MREVVWKGHVLNRRLATAAPLLLLVLAACPPRDDAGFDKVAVRRDLTIARPAMPDPPPVTAAFAGPVAPTPVVPAELPPGVTQEMVAEGQQLYGTLCVACHGAAGVGGPVGPALNDQQWLHITGEYEEIVHITTVGVPQPLQYPAPMPPRGGGPFTDEQIRAISAYVYAISRVGG
jgi:mono/diheme cytochrome c family protein